MTQNRSLAYGDPLPEQFVDSIQELLGSYASPNLVLDLLNPTTARIVASTGNGQVCLAINGRHRYITTTVTAAHPGGAAGTHALYATGSDNSFGGGPPEVDSTVYAFALEIRTSGTPATAIYRQIATVEWDGSAITAIRPMLGFQAIPFVTTDLVAINPTTAARNTVKPTTDVVALTIGLTSGHTSDRLRVLNAASSVVASIDSAGRVQVPAGSAANPGVGVQGDSHTGLYAPANDQVSIATGGAEALRVGVNDATLLGDRAMLLTLAAPADFAAMKFARALGTTDTQPRLTITNTGKLQFGSGTATADTTLQRDDSRSMSIRAASGSVASRLGLERPDKAVRYIELDNFDQVLVGT